jgi:hypothetical protein
MSFFFTFWLWQKKNEAGESKVEKVRGGAVKRERGRDRKGK